MFLPDGAVSKQITSAFKKTNFKAGRYITPALSPILGNTLAATLHVLSDVTREKYPYFVMAETYETVNVRVVTDINCYYPRLCSCTMARFHS